MKSTSKILGICLGSALLMSCAGRYDYEDLGTVLGVGTEAVHGSTYTDNATGIVTGSGEGALIGRSGREVGRQTDDRYRYEGYHYTDRYYDGDGYRYGY